MVAPSTPVRFNGIRAMFFPCESTGSREGDSLSPLAKRDGIPQHSRKLKNPRIEFVVNRRKICFSPAGDKSKYAGSINVTDGGKYPASTWYGAIKSNGEFYRSSACDDFICRVIADFNASPAEYAAAYGRKSGVCVFCSTRLTDERSVGVGFGPTCAKNWGLWDKWKLWAGEFAGQKKIGLGGIGGGWEKYGVSGSESSGSSEDGTSFPAG